MLLVRGNCLGLCVCLCACLSQQVGKRSPGEQYSEQFRQGVHSHHLLVGTGCLFSDLQRSLYKLQSRLSTDPPCEMFQKVHTLMPP